MKTLDSEKGLWVSVYKAVIIGLFRLEMLDEASSIVRVASIAKAQADQAVMDFRESFLRGG